MFNGETAIHKLSIFVAITTFYGTLPGARSGAAAPPAEPGAAVIDSLGTGGSQASGAPSISSNLAPRWGFGYSALLPVRSADLPGGMGGFHLRPAYGQVTHPSIFEPTARELHTTRLHSGILGADRGAFAGMGLGFLGMEAGLWSERTAWYLMGAGAALGAVWGSTVGSSPIGVSVRVEPDPRSEP